MNSNININYRSIQAFKDLSDKGIEQIKENANFVKYSIGQPILDEGILPLNISIILSGEARLLDEKENLKSQTISKIKSDEFIGLSSILKNKNCEFVIASTNVLALVLSNDLIFDLYKNEESFKTWCDNYLSISETYDFITRIKASYYNCNSKYHKKSR